MTEQEVQNALWFELRQKGHDLICPNYTPLGWFECDVFSVTKSGYFFEHEIKLTVSDFRADVHKQRDEWVSGWGPDQVRNTDKKHDLINGANIAGPRAFFYVAPEGMLTAEQVPAWAGLMEASYGNEWSAKEQKILPTKTIGLKVLKEAPKLHKHKVDPKVIEHLQGLFYWRYWNLRTKKLK